MATDLPDYYAILQVHANAGQEVIDAAYRRLARKYHPDVNPAPDAAQIMAELNHAYEVLSDPEKRSDYDAWLEWARRPRQDDTPFAASSSPTKPITKGAWWRWVLVPVALPFGYLIPGLVARVATELTMGGWGAGYYARIVQSVIGGYCAIYFPGKLAPRGQPLTALVALMLLTAFVTAMIAISFVTNYWRDAGPGPVVWVLVDAGLSLVAGAFAFWSVFRGEDMSA